MCEGKHIFDMPEEYSTAIVHKTHSVVSIATTLGPDTWFVHMRGLGESTLYKTYTMVYIAI